MRTGEMWNSNSVVSWALTRSGVDLTAVRPPGNGRAPGWDANGMNHMCLAVDDIDAVLKRIEAAGIALLLPLKTAVDGNRQAWIEDPDGNRIELMEMDANSLQLRAIARLRREAVPA